MIVEDDQNICAPDHQLLIDNDGLNIYHVFWNRINQFSIKADGNLRFIETLHDSIVRAVLSNDGDYLYAVHGSGLWVIERDQATGRLAKTDFNSVTLNTPSQGPVPLVITDDDSYLFVFDQSGEQTNLLSLKDPANPERLDVLSEFWDADWRSSRCRFGAVRAGLIAVDVFCPALTFTVSWDAESESLEGVDSLSTQTTDKYNGIPIPDFGSPAGFAESPDKQYLYLSTPRDGIVSFARNPPPQEENEAPDLAISSVTVDNPSLLPLDSFTLTSTVQNRGTAYSPSSTLRFYRSSDARINRNDTQGGLDTIPILSASESRMHSVDLTAPRDPGRYYYGACADEVPLESDVDNNCSDSVIVTVIDPADSGQPDRVVESPTVSDRHPMPNRPLLLGVTARNRGDGDAPRSLLRFFRSSNNNITLRDERVGDKFIDGIAAHGFADHSITVLTPASPSTVYFRACVTDVTNESDVENNCSEAVRVVVEEVTETPDLALRGSFVDANQVQPEDSFTFTTRVVNLGRGESAATTLRYYFSSDGTIDDGGDTSVDYCTDDAVIHEGNGCEIYETGGFTFEVESTGRGCLRAGGLVSCSESQQSFQNVTNNGIVITLVAARNDDDSCTIDDV